MSPLELKIRSFIAENFLFSDDPHELPADESLLERGVIDSTGVLELVSYLESEFGVVLDDTELVPENLDTIGRITATVSAKQAQA